MSFGVVDVERKSVDLKRGWSVFEEFGDPIKK
jgi:hypothetical protein